MKSKLLIILTAAILSLTTNITFGQVAPTLGATSSFALFTATGAFTVTGASVVTGDVGNHVGANSAFLPGTLIGSTHWLDGLATTAATDVDAAYTQMSGMGGTVIGVGLGSGQTLTPGVYQTGAASTLNGNLTLDAGGDASKLFIIRIGGAFAAGAGSTVTLINSASLCNVYWQIGGQFDLAAGSVFRGTVIVDGAINLLGNSSLLGRGLSKAGAISLAANVVTVPFVGTPVFTLGATSNRCEGAGSVTYTATATNSTGITYSLDAASIAGSNSINALTGAVTYNVAWSGTTIITAIAAGCSNGPTSTTHTVTVNPTLVASVSIAAVPSGAICAGTSVSFTATPTNGGTTPAYQWKKGGTAISGETNLTYTSTTLANTDAITIVMTSNATPCLTGSPATSPGLTMTVNALPATSVITGNLTPLCNEIGVIYSVTLTAGSNYVWTVPAGATITAGAAGPNNNQITVTFGTAGGNIAVTETTAASCIGSAKTLAISLTGCGLNSSFTGTPLSVCLGSMVTFTNTSTGTSGATTYSWNFGAGATPATANTIGPIAVTYNTSGLKTVSLTITDGTTSTTTQTNYITVNALPTAPTVGLKTQPTCAVATGSAALSGLPAAGNWTVTESIGSTTITGTGTTANFSGLSANTYTFKVTDAGGCTSIASGNAVINAQPQTPSVTNKIISIVTGTAFTVAPGGVPVGTTYSWTVPTYTGGVTGGSAQSNQTNISETLSIPSGSGTATYSVTPTSGSCVGTPFSVVVTVTSSAVPVTIGTQPADNSMCSMSGNSSFTVVPAGTAPFTYQWQYNNGGIWAAVVNGTPGGAVYTNATTATLGVSGITAGGSYQYQSYITNASGVNNATSNVVTLTVNNVPSAPVFTTTQPNCSVATGSAVFSGLPAGAWTLTRTPGAVVTNGSGANYTISGLATGTYTYTLTNGITLCTSAASADVVINAQPSTPSVANQTRSISSGSAFSVAPVGVPAGTTYSWTVPIYTSGVTGGSAQSNQTTMGETLFIPTGTGTASYTVTPTSGICVGVPFTVVVTVTSSCVPVTIGTQPGNTGLCAPSGNASIIVVAAGTAPFTYQWQYNNGGVWAAVANGTPSGAVYINQNTATLGISGITVNGSYQYRSYVTNCTGLSNVLSNGATLTVNTSPAAPITGKITQTDCFIATGSVILSGLPATGTWTITGTPGGTTTTGTGTSTTVTGVPIGTSTFTVTDGTTLCTSISSSAVVINPQPIPAAPTVTLTQPDCAVATGTILITAPTGIGMTYSIDGTTYTNTSGIFINVPMGTYTVTAKNADGCISKK